MIGEIKIDAFDYDLPEERIARFPLEERDASKLLVWRDGQISDLHFRDLPQALPQGALLVFNNTKVIRARIIMHKPTGARMEIFCLEPCDPADYERAFAVKGSCVWKCLVGNRRKWKDEPLEIKFEKDGAQHTMRASRGESEGMNTMVRFEWDADMTFGELLVHLGRIPIPPYLNRESEEIDNTRYQTVYSRFEGSVAAPTAGLHFTDSLMERMRGMGFGFQAVTLHVGAGTFLPVKDQDARNHVMHTEHFEFSAETVRSLLDNLGHIFPVGTTSVRTVESLPALAYRIVRSGHPMPEIPIGQWEIYNIPVGYDIRELLTALLEWMERKSVGTIKASTRIMITPYYRYRILDGVITNFHQPKSTLLLLVGALVGDAWKDIYAHALDGGYRFLSYGDSSLLFRKRD